VPSGREGGTYASLTRIPRPTRTLPGYVPLSRAKPRGRVAGGREGGTDAATPASAV